MCHVFNEAWHLRSGLKTEVMSCLTSLSLFVKTLIPVHYRLTLKMVKHINNWAEFQQELKSGGNTLIVVDFTAKWCGPCKRISPIFEKMAEEFDDVIFVKVDVDEASDVSQNCGVSCMPTFQFYKRGEKLHEFSGANEKTLREKVLEYK